MPMLKPTTQSHNSLRQSINQPLFTRLCADGLFRGGTREMPFPFFAKLPERMSYIYVTADGAGLPI